MSLPLHLVALMLQHATTMQMQMKTMGPAFMKMSAAFAMVQVPFTNVDAQTSQRAIAIAMATNSTIAGSAAAMACWDAPI